MQQFIMFQFSTCLTSSVFGAVYIKMFNTLTVEKSRNQLMVLTFTRNVRTERTDLQVSKIKTSGIINM